MNDVNSLSKMDIRSRRRQDEAIRLREDGHWYHGDYPILHERTVTFLHKNIAVTEYGEYYLTGEDKPIPIIVEDTPYWVTHVERTIAGYLITLTDGTLELLDPDTLWIGKNKALYCMVKGAYLPAKFFPNAHNEMAKDIEEQGKDFVLKLGRKVYPVGSVAPKLGIFLAKKRPAKKSKSSRKSRLAKRATVASQEKPVPAKKVVEKKAAPQKASSPKKSAASKKSAPSKKKTPAKAKSSSKKTTKKPAAKKASASKKAPAKTKSSNKKAKASKKKK